MPLDSPYNYVQGIAGTPGPTGPAGTPGAQWRWSGTVPSNSTGLDGDWHINTATGDMYCRIGGTYLVQFNAKGPKGDTGNTGNIGPAGTSAFDSVVKTSQDRATSNATATDVPDLSIALLANSAYEFEAILRAASSSSAGCKYAVQFSAAGASAYAVYTGATAATTAAVTATNALNSLEATAFLAAAIDGLVVIRGLIFTGANAGNLTIQQAKVTSGTATVRANSTLKVRKV